MQSGFTITGAKELQAKLDTLGRKVEKRVLKKAVRAGQNVLLKRARANARALPQSARFGGAIKAVIAKNIVIKTPRKQQRGTYSLHVQMRPGMDAVLAAYTKGSHTTLKDRKEHATRHYLPALIEYGHGSNPRQAARPFMRPAAASTRTETVRVLQLELQRGIFREAIKGRYL